MKNIFYKTVSRLLWVLLIVLLTILFFSFLMGEYLVFSDRALLYHGDNSIRSSKLYIPLPDKNIVLYTTWSSDHLLLSTWWYISFRDSFIDWGDIYEKHLPTKIGLLSHYTLFTSNDILLMKSFLTQEANHFEQLFWEKISEYQHFNNKELFWRDKDTILILGMIEKDCELIINCDGWKYAIYADLQDRRLGVVDNNWFGDMRPYLLFFKKSIYLPISRFGIFKEIWYINN